MTHEIGPWGPRNPPRRRRRPDLGRLGLWLCLAAALAGLVWALARAFPEAVETTQDWTWVAYRAGFVLLIAAAIFRARRGLRRAHLRYAALWAAILALLALGFAYREELRDVPEHLQLAFSAGDPVRTTSHELVVPQHEDGGFVVVGKVNGQRVRFIVDTGASDTVLSPADARRLGLDVDHLRYSQSAETANGRGYGAPYQARRLEVGPVAFDGFDMTVNQAPLSSSLLGLSFLNRLESFQIKDHKLILRWRAAA